MTKIRIMSALIGIIMACIFIFWGSLPFLLITCIIAIIAIYEYHKLTGINDLNISIIINLFSLFIIVYTYLSNRRYISPDHGLILFCFLLIFFIYHVFFIKNNIIQIMSINILGLIYISGGFSVFILLRDFMIEPFNATAALWLALLATWSTDVAAYFTGKYLGKHPLSRRLSPNKTIEGAVGGIMGCVLITLIFTTILQQTSSYWIIYGFSAAIISIIGDLFESGLKRDVGVKDTGTIMPGHGGILDRFDSLLFTVPFTYFYLHMVL